MAYNYDKDTLDSLYDIGAERWGHPNTRKEVRLHYNRAVMYPYCYKRAQSLSEQLGGDTSKKILIVGAGSGWTVEAMQELGFSNCIGTETSEYLNSILYGNEDADVEAGCLKVGAPMSIRDRILDQHGNKICNSVDAIFDEDSMTEESRGRIIAELGSPDVVVTEDVIQTMSDEEAVSFARALEGYQVDVYHFMSTDDKGKEHWDTLLGAGHKPSGIRGVL